MLVTYLEQATSLFVQVLFLALTILALVGAIMVATTREDAFTAADRQSKWVWLALLAGSSLAIISGIWILPWIGIVITGLYWFDVRPQIKDILSGNSSW